MFVFVGVLLFLGLGFDAFLVGNGEIGFPFGSLAALAGGGASAFASYYSGDRAVLLSAGAVPIDRALSAASGDAETLQIRQLDNVVEEMSIAAGLPKPRVYLVPDSDPNAFATGRDAESAGRLHGAPRDGHRQGR